ncbi:MAG: hypothetical protein K5930_00820 [Treponemataceae bacterium]|nr:hypothetical protein [Treponemataceae bacterium]
MRRKLIPLFIFFCLFPAFFLSAEDIIISDMQMTVLPRDVFVGDEMEIRCTFSCDKALLPEGSLSESLTPGEIKDMTVLGITLQSAGSSYVLSMLCIPWNLGVLDIPPVLISEHSGDEETAVYLDVSDITVKSIVGYTGASELRPAKAPLLIPGTTWIIYILSILGIVILVVIVVILVRFPSFKNKVQKVVSSAIIVKNYYSLRFQLRRLVKSRKPVSDKRFAYIVSHILREYISCRFFYNFRSETPKGIVLAFNQISCGLFSVEAGEAVQMISELLSRCDYIRFSGDEGEKGSLSTDERARICEAAIDAASCLEKDDYDAKV